MECLEATFLLDSKWREIYREFLQPLLSGREFRCMQIE